MPLIKLNRINKGGEIFVNSDHILFMELEFRTTTVHMLQNLLFSVEDPLESIVATIERIEAERIATGIKKSGLAPTPAAIT